MTILRGILGAIIGYIAMAVALFACLGLTWLVLGAEGAFAGEGPDPSTPWVLSSLAFGLVTAIFGGFVARKVGGGAFSVKGLAGLILVLGLLVAVTAESMYEKRSAAVPKDKSVAEMGFIEAGKYAKNPGWYNWLIPLVGVAGTMIGGREREA